MSEKYLQKMSKDNKMKNAIVMRDPIVVDWKLKLIEKFFEKSTQIASDNGVSSKEGNAIDCKLVELTTIGKELGEEEKRVTDTENIEIVELAEFNEYNYWKEHSDKETELKVNEEVISVPEDLMNEDRIDGDTNKEMPEYYDNNWWKLNNDIQNVQVEIKSDDIGGEHELIAIPKPSGDKCKSQENVISVDSVESDISEEISTYNEFNWWKQDIKTKEIDPEIISKPQKHPIVENFPQKNGMKNEKLLKSNSRSISHKLPSRGQNVEKGKSNPKQKCQVSDRNNNLATEEKPPGSVVMIYNLNPQFMDCDRLFSFISPYTLVKSIKFLQKGGFQKAMVELNNKEGAQRVMKFIKDEMFLGKMLRFEPSPKLTVTEFNPEQLPSLPNGTKAFKDFSQDNRKLCLDHSRPSTMYPPSRTIYFHKTPKMSDEDFKEFFEKRKAPVPYKIMWFQNYGGMGCLQFKTKEEALKAMCIANLALTKSGQRVHMAFTYERTDGQFYSKK